MENNLLFNQIQKELKEFNQKIILILDFDQTLIDTYNSVLLPTIKEIGVNLGTFKEFQNRHGSFFKYSGKKGEHLKNFIKYISCNKKEFKKRLKSNYLENAQAFPELVNIIKKVNNLPNIEIGVVSRSFISKELSPEEMIKNTLKKLNFPQFSFIKRVDYKKSKTKTYIEIRNQYSEDIIISIGDEIGDYISAKSARFDEEIAIEGFDSNELFELKEIKTTPKEKLENKLLTIIHSKLISGKEIESKFI